MTEKWRKIECVIEEYLRREEFEIEFDKDHFAIYLEYDDALDAWFELSINITRLVQEIADAIE